MFFKGVWVSLYTAKAELGIGNPAVLITEKAVDFLTIETLIKHGLFHNLMSAPFCIPMN